MVAYALVMGEWLYTHHRPTATASNNNNNNNNN
jgi:hypothetical protein